MGKTFHFTWREAKLIQVGIALVRNRKDNENPHSIRLKECDIDTDLTGVTITIPAARVKTRE